MTDPPVGAAPSAHRPDQVAARLQVRKRDLGRRRAEGGRQAEGHRVQAEPIVGAARHGRRVGDLGRRDPGPRPLQQRFDQGDAVGGRAAGRRRGDGRNDGRSAHTRQLDRVQHAVHLHRRRGAGLELGIVAVEVHLAAAPGRLSAFADVGLARGKAQHR
jgi:hypothetical protein